MAKSVSLPKSRVNPAEHHNIPLDDEDHPGASRNMDWPQAWPMLRLYPHDEDPWDYPDTTGCWKNTMIENPVGPSRGNVTKKGQDLQDQGR